MTGLKRLGPLGLMAAMALVTALVLPAAGLAAATSRSPRSPSRLTKSS